MLDNILRRSSLPSSSSVPSTPFSSSSSFSSILNDPRNYESSESDDRFESEYEKEARRDILNLQRMTPHILARAQGSMHNWVTNVAKFRDKRNEYECATLAMIIDDMIREGIDKYTSIAMERAARRLAGVHAADQQGRWEVCTAMELSNSSATLVPAPFLANALKQASQLRQLTQPYNNNNYSNYNRGRGGYLNNRGRGRGGAYQSTNNPNFIDINNNRSTPYQSSNSSSASFSNERRGGHGDGRRS